MSRHFTPRALAEYIAQYVPSETKTLLEPCAGQGDLISPLVAKLSAQTRYTCLDKNGNSLLLLRKRLGRTLNNRLFLSKADFLSWESEYEKAYDCVVMNPPFSGKRATWTSLTFAGKDIYPKRKVPLEAAFFIKALHHVRDGGTIVSILPSSIVAGSSLDWVRRELRAQGSICVVHELPPFTFRGIEAQFFIVTYRKGNVGTKTLLLNHELYNPEVRELSEGEDNSEIRLDFAFSEAAKTLSQWVGATSHLRWTALDRLATVARGNVSAPFPKTTPPLHTWDFNDGFWASPRNTRAPLPVNGELLAAPGDIVVARVGRNARQSIGVLTGSRKTKFSDCLFRIRPKRNVPAVLLLLALKSIYCNTNLYKLVERGTGAKYITARALLRCLIPTNFPEKYQELIRQYQNALKQRNISQMQDIERRFEKLVSSFVTVF